MSDKNIAFVADGQIPPSPPPPATTGPMGWIKENLFSGFVNSILTILAFGLILWLVPGVIQWAFIDGVWNAASLKECREINAHGACWAVIVERFDQFIYGFYPNNYPTGIADAGYARWRPDLAFLLLLVAIAFLLFDKMPFRRYGMIFAAVYPVIAYFLIWGGSVWGPLMMVAVVPVSAIVFAVVVRFANALFAFAAGALAAALWLLFIVGTVDEAITKSIGDGRYDARVAELETLLESDIAATVRAAEPREAMRVEDEALREKMLKDISDRVRTTANAELTNLRELPTRVEELRGLRPEVDELADTLPSDLLAADNDADIRTASQGLSEETMGRFAEWQEKSGRITALENRIWFTYRDLGRVGLAPVESRALGGFLLAVIIGVAGIALSLPIGILLALGRRSSMMFIQTICITFIEFIRGVPLITLLFVASSVLAYFFPPGSNLDVILRVVIMVTLFASAYMAEVIRGGLAALPQGQYEAADSLGLDYWKSMQLIILPQALKISIPNIVSSFIGLFKDTTLVVVIGLLDPIGLINTTRADSAWNGIIWEFYVFVGLFFFIVCFGMSRYSMYLERKLKTDR